MKKFNRIRILMISSNADLGGGPKQMFLLGENLDKNFEVYYAAPKNKNFSKYLNSKNFIEISKRRINPKDIFNLVKFSRDNFIDIIHAHGKGAGVLARFTNLFYKKKLIYTFHGIHVECHNLLMKFLYLNYENLFGRMDNYKIFVSDSEKEYAKKLKVFVGDKTVVIHNGVLNKNALENKTDRNNVYRKNSISKIKVVSICRFVRQKNVKDIINIAKRMPEIDFNIVGYGKLWNEINQYLFEMQIENVDLIGLKKNVFKYLNSADIFLSTSLYEGMPLSILEAMSVGLPIVASNVVGNVDTIDNGKTGYLYDLNNLDMAVKYLEKLALDKSLRNIMGYNSFKRQREIFSKEIMISKYKKLYESFF